MTDYKKAAIINAMQLEIVQVAVDGLLNTLAIDADDPAQNTKAAFEVMRTRDFAYDALDRASFNQLRDLYAFIRWAKTKGQRIGWIAGQVMHDLAGLQSGDDFFSPRTYGYFKKFPTLLSDGKTNSNRSKNLSTKSLIDRFCEYLTDQGQGAV